MRDVGGGGYGPFEKCMRMKECECGLWAVARSGVACGQVCHVCRTHADAHVRCTALSGGMRNRLRPVSCVAQVRS